MHCLNCDKEYELSEKELRRGFKEGTLRGRFCSTMCGGKYFGLLKRHKPNMVCPICKSEFYLKKSRKKTVSGLNFCSRKCKEKAQEINVGVLRATHYKRTRNCKCMNCNNLLDTLKKYTAKFCSFKCRVELRYKDYIKRWLVGEETGNRGYCVSPHVKRWLIEKFKNKCSRCGWSEVNTKTDKVPVEVEHIDGDYRNSRPENLDLLCPNCHSLTPTYRGLNLGYGRKNRKKYNLPS